jgi:hypothetical protein
LYKSDGEIANCLKLDSPPFQMGDSGDYELGQKGKKEISTYYSGKYSKLIFEVISEKSILQFSLEELQIMRNEVFARYGYIFKSGGKMDTYFKAQKWYRGTNKNVDDFITSIERANLDTILKVEAKKKAGN